MNGEAKRRRIDVDVDGVGIDGAAAVTPSIGHLLAQWRENLDGSFEQVVVDEKLSNMALREAAPDEILVKSMQGK